jgi:hypothetical protein
VSTTRTRSDRDADRHAPRPGTSGAPKEGRPAFCTRVPVPSVPLRGSQTHVRDCVRRSPFEYGWRGGVVAWGRGGVARRSGSRLLICRSRFDSERPHQNPTTSGLAIGARAGYRSVITLNPKAAGSNPARPIRYERTRHLLPAPRQTARGDPKPDQRRAAPPPTAREVEAGLRQLQGSTPDARRVLAERRSAAQPISLTARCACRVGPRVRGPSSATRPRTQPPISKPFSDQLVMPATAARIGAETMKPAEREEPLTVRRVPVRRWRVLETRAGRTGRVSSPHAVGSVARLLNELPGAAAGGPVPSPFLTES